jgi:hypothetical protein
MQVTSKGAGPSRRWAAACAVAVTAGAFGVAAPAAAAPERTTETVTDLVSVWASDQYDRAVFVNTTREQFCRPEKAQWEQDLFDWFAGGQEGEPPAFPGDEGAVPITFEAQRVAADNYKSSFTAKVPVEVWTFEVGKSTAAGNLFGPCLDTDGLDDATREPLESAGMLQAAGSGMWAGADNDAFGTGPRSNVWGTMLDAELSGPDGGYRLKANESNHSIDGEYKAGSVWVLLKPR